MATTSGNITASGDSVILSSYSADTKVIISVSGTYAAGLELTFQISGDGGTNWQSFPGSTIDNYATVESKRTLVANEVRVWRMIGADVGTKVKVVASAWASPSGTCAVVITSYPDQGSSAGGSSNPSKVFITDINAGDYETVAASQSDQVLGATGAAGDYLAGILIVPGTTSPGAVSIKDGSGSGITIFTGGASSVVSLVSFLVPLGIISANGAWKVTTGTNVTAIGVGNFT